MEGEHVSGAAPTRPASEAAPAGSDGGRAATPLATSGLVRISLFWLGLTSIDAVVNAAVQSRIKFEHLVEPGTEGGSLAIIAVLTFIFSVAIQPTVGSISDYASTRWGRRKPFIVVGAVLDATFLVGIATASSFVAIAALVTLLALSTNVARGPFQGYVPDLVPARQVGLASSMVGLMQVLGNVVGFGLAAVADIEGSVGLAIVAVAAIEIATMLGVVLRVPNGPAAKARGGRSWLSIAAETWGTDILRERSYLWLLASRLFVLMGGAALLNFVKLYLADVHGLSQAETGAAFLNMLIAVVVVSLIAIVPAARLSDRYGRKPVIYACTALGIAGVVVIAVAPSVLVATIGAALFGASQGTFLAVDWALMTDIIPRASSGRYMGLSNVVTASSTTIAVTIGGPLIDALNRSGGVGTGERAELVAGAIYFAVGAVALVRVREPARRSAAAPIPVTSV
jgi:MFS family permease